MLGTAHPCVRDSRASGCILKGCSGQLSLGGHEIPLLPEQRSALCGFECGSLHPQCSFELAFFTGIFEPLDQLDRDRRNLLLCFPACLFLFVCLL